MKLDKSTITGFLVRRLNIDPETMSDKLEIVDENDPRIINKSSPGITIIDFGDRAFMWYRDSLVNTGFMSYVEYNGKDIRVDRLSRKRILEIAQTIYYMPYNSDAISGRLYSKIGKRKDNKKDLICTNYYRYDNKKADGAYSNSARSQYGYYVPVDKSGYGSIKVWDDEYYRY